MKNLFLLTFALFSVLLFSQTSTENYIKTTTYKIATTQSFVFSPSVANLNITYFDGLGRPIQQIAHQQSGSGKDIVTPIEYDAFGRQTKEYLPYVPDVPASQDYKPNALTDVFNFPQYSGQNPFSEKEFEISPLNRVLKQAAPGTTTDWALGSGHEIKFEYQANTASDTIKLFSITTNWNATKGLYDIPSSLTATDYLDYQLYKTITYDENTAAAPTETNGSTVEFKNKQGQIILKRTYGTVGMGTTNEKHDTYYVYDDFGNLTFVIPPKALDIFLTGTTVLAEINSTAIVSSGSNLALVAANSITLSPSFHAQAGCSFSAKIENGTLLDDLCYQYKYDQRNRLVEKKLPGKQWEFILYDKLDRVVATGPALSPFNDTTAGAVGWLITKYDVFSRPVYTGWEPAETVNGNDRTAKQNALNLATTFNESKQTSGTIDGIQAYYTNTVAPTIFKLLTVNYYDNYVFPGLPNLPINRNVKGLATGSWTRVPTSISAKLDEVTSTSYDNKARPIKNYVKNFLGGETNINYTLDFTGKIVNFETSHKRLSTDSAFSTINKFTFSPQGRLLTQTHQNLPSGPIETIASNTYDELGQLISKTVGGGIQKIDYSYNIRGWLKGINNVSALQQGSSDPKDLFAFAINYNTTPSGIPNVKALYNGNIAETQWATNSDNGIIRTYGYRYDELNRLKEGVYKNGSILNTYNESMSYDKNGNITNLTRYGSLNDNTQTLIDNLTYDYKNNSSSNQLMKVSDAIANNANFINEFKDGSSNLTDDFSYDANGNMTKDNNKNITSITYNHLNLPTKITFANTGNIVYIYNSAGQKVQKVVNRTGQPAETTDYIGGFQYTNGVLKFFPTSEGYVEPSGSSYKYVYQYKDHLGNVRLSYDKNLIIQEENNYYPFGLKQAGYNNVISSTNSALKYKYNGKEYQDELGLNLYDYQARNYDPALGKWMNIDPKAEEFQEYSPYNYCENNPVYFIDPDGKGPTVGGQSAGAAIILGGLTAAGQIGIVSVGPQGAVLVPAGIAVAVGSLVAGGAVMLWDAMTGSDDSSSTTTYNATAGKAPSIEKSTNNKANEKSTTSEPSKLKEGSKGQKLEEKLKKSGEDGNLPTPKTDKGQFKDKKGEIVHKETDAIYRKSNTTHRGKEGEFKIWPKGTTEFGKTSKTTGARITTDLNGKVIGH